MFTQKELSFIYPHYFEKIRIQEDFIEIQFINTKHFWIIKKSLFKNILFVAIYHKHSAKIPYYHKHSKPNVSIFSVEIAIKQIISHDNFVLNLIN